MEKISEINRKEILTIHKLLVFILVLFGLCLTQLQSYAQDTGSKILLGRFSDGTQIWAERSQGQGWDLKTQGSTFASAVYTRPVQLEFQNDYLGTIKEAHGYDSIFKTRNGFHGNALISKAHNVSISVNDQWEISGPILWLSRSVSVKGNDKGGFMSAITIFTEKPWARPDVDIFAPGMIYGGTDNIPATGPGGKNIYEDSRGIVLIREERFPAPLFAVHFQDNSSISLLHSDPTGGTTKDDAMDISRSDILKSLIDARFQFGSLGEDESGDWKGNPYEPIGESLRKGAQRYPAIGFWFPGTEGEVRAGFGPAHLMRRRFHPIQDGLSHSYRLGFRFGRDEDFPTLVKDSWRWAWETLKPPVTARDIELIRDLLLDLLAKMTMVSDGRAIMPTLADATTGEIPSDHRNGRMGFIGRNLDGADLFLMESARTTGERSKKFHDLGVMIVNTFANLKFNPPESVGLWVDDGRPMEGLTFLRLLTDDMFYMLTAWEREHKMGQSHPLWLQRCKEFGGWLLTKQDSEGGFPRAWIRNSNEVAMPSKLNTYNAMAFLVKLSQVTGEKKYLDASIKAGNFSWESGQYSGTFVGGTPDNPNVIDKEAAVLSLNGYLSLYEATKEKKWLDRARLAGNVGETWIYIWNIPMPADIEDKYLSWKHGVSTIGQQLIATGHSGADSWMSHDVTNYVKLYKYTNDVHYLEVARLLLHDTKGMIALPGQTYDLVGPGWQEEAWGFVAPVPRFPGTRRVWLPWMPINHLRGIFDLEEYDPLLFKQLCNNVVE
jgi:hypothetical protein